MPTYRSNAARAADRARGQRRRTISARDVTDATLAHVDAVDGRVGAYLTRAARSRARTRGAASTRASRAGERLPLAGVPLAVKDNMCLAGTRTTCGSKILEHWIAPYTATAVARMLDAGCVPIGKTNLDEFAMGSSCENSALGVTRNPYDLDARSRRIERRIGGGGCRARSGDRLGQRHRRLDSRARRVLQSRRIQADVRPRFALRAHRVRIEPRSDRAAHAHGRRRGARVRCDGGLRSDGRDVDRPCRRADGERAARGSARRADRHRARVRYRSARRRRSTPLYDRRTTISQRSAPNSSRCRCRPPTTVWRRTT